MIYLWIHLFKLPPFLKWHNLSIIDAVNFIKIIYCILMSHSFQQEAFHCKKSGTHNIINSKILPIISTKAGICTFQTHISIQPIFYSSHQFTYWPFPVRHFSILWPISTATPFCHWIIHSFHFKSYGFCKAQSSSYLSFIPSPTTQTSSPDSLIPVISLNPVCIMQSNTPS